MSLPSFPCPSPEQWWEGWNWSSSPFFPLKELQEQKEFHKINLLWIFHEANAGLTQCDPGGQTQLQAVSNLTVAMEILLDFPRLLPTEGCSLLPCIELNQFHSKNRGTLALGSMKKAQAL